MRLFISLTILIFVNFFPSKPLFSQMFDIQSPLEIPLFLSGNFGELRSTHFHAGIDIKTLGETGKKVFSVAGGYVSRVKIQTGGYGHSIYIRHPNGYTSVYAHLNSFFPELEEYVKDQQYASKKFEIDLFPDVSKFQVIGGQFIGISGNTGSSGGPHLHLEIRDKNEVPLNVLKYNLPVKDTIPPVFKTLVVYQSIDNLTFECARKDLIPVIAKGNNYWIDKPVRVSDFTGFGIEVYDYLNGSQNKCGIYTLDFSIDNQLIFSVKFDNVSFNEASYIKTYSDYAEKKMNGSSIHRMFIEPNNLLSIYNSSFNKGIFGLSDTLVHKAKISTVDVYGNKSELNFNLIHNFGSTSIISKPIDDIYLNWNRDSEYANEFIKFKVPAGALYANKSMNYSSSTATSDFYAHVYKVGDELIPMQKYPQLSIKISDSIKVDKPDKLVIVRIDTTGKIISEGGKTENNWTTANVNGFGKYSVMCDSIKPEIKPVSYRSGKWYGKGDVISFKITDNLSGIDSYCGYIDNNWVLMEYDAKSDSLYYNIDEKRLEKKKTPHDIKIIVTDERKNSEIFTGKFYY